MFYEFLSKHSFEDLRVDADFASATGRATGTFKSSAHVHFLRKVEPVLAQSRL
jgi:hypothetical protein